MANNYSNLDGYVFEKQSNVGWGLTLKMSGKAPEVAKRIFDTLAHAQAYIDDVNDSAIEGLVLRVVNDGDNNGVYFVESVKSSADGSSGVMTKLSTTAGASGELGDAIKALDFDDSAVEGEYISEIDQTDGKISVKRAALVDASVAVDASGNTVTLGEKFELISEEIAAAQEAAIAAATKINEKAEGHVTVAGTQDENGTWTYTVSENDIASAQDLSTAVARLNEGGDIAKAIADNASAIADNASAIAENASDIAENASAIAAVDASLDEEIARAKKAEEDLQSAIDAINSEENGVLKQAKDYADAHKQEVDASIDDLQSDVEDLADLVGTKAGDSSLTATTVWAGLDELASKAAGDVKKVEDHLKSEFVTAADAQAVSVTASGDEYKSFEVALNLAADEKVLSQTAAGLKTNLGLNWDSSTKKIELLGIDGAVVADIDATDFVKDGMINAVEYANGKLTITWNEDGDKTESTVIDLGELFDIENVVVADDSSAFLGAKLDASVIELSAKMGDFAADNQVNGLASTSAVKSYVDGLFAESDAVLADVSADLAAHLVAYGEKMTAVDGSVLANAQAIDAIEAQIAGFDYVETSVFEGFKSDVSAAQAAQDASINANAAAIADVSSKVAALNDTYVSEDELTAYKAEVSTAIETAISTEDASIKGYVDGLIATADASIDALQAAVEALNDKNVEIDSSIDALQAADEAFTNKVAEIDSSITALKSKDEELDSSIDALQAKDIEIDSSITALQGVDEAHDASIAENAEAIAAINATLTWTVL